MNDFARPASFSVLARYGAEAPMSNGRGVRAHSSATPVVRWAVLVRIIEPPSADEAQALLAALAKNWTRAAPRYHDLVARTAGIEPDSLHFVEDETVRIGFDGKTPTIDFPRLRSHGSATLPLGPFDTRICIALCTKHQRPAKQLSSKVWSRVGLPMSGDTAAEIDLRRLQAVVPHFRQISRTSARWGFDMLKAVLRDTLPVRKARRKSELEVSVLGSADARLSPHYERLSMEEGVTADELLATPAAVKALSRYFHPLAGADEALAVASDHDDRFWFSYPTTVPLANGDLQRRDVLYLMRSSEEAAHALGVGFDDSARHELPRRSALQVSRWIANRV